MKTAAVQLYFRAVAIHNYTDVSLKVKEKLFYKKTLQRFGFLFFGCFA